MPIKEKIYRQIHKFRFEKEYKKYESEKKNFNGFISSSNNVAFLMPCEETAFRAAMNIAVYFKIHKKNITLFLPEHFRNLVTGAADYVFFTLPADQIESELLPPENLLRKINDAAFDILFDLTIAEKLFMSALALKIPAEFKVALFRKEKEKIYNLLFNQQSSNNLEKSFRNLLNSIQMF